MTEIERKALALINEVRVERGWGAHTNFSRYSDPTCEALCRAIEQHEALCRAIDWYKLLRLIFPKPDPLVEALNEAGDTSPLSDDAFEDAFADAFAKELRQALAARGLKIVEIGQ